MKIFSYKLLILLIIPLIFVLLPQNANAQTPPDINECQSELNGQIERCELIDTTYYIRCAKRGKDYKVTLFGKKDGQEFTVGTAKTKTDNIDRYLRINFSGELLDIPNDVDEVWTRVEWYGGAIAGWGTLNKNDCKGNYTLNSETRGRLGNYGWWPTVESKNCELIFTGGAGKLKYEITVNDSKDYYYPYYILYNGSGFKTSTKSFNPHNEDEVQRWAEGPLTILVTTATNVVKNVKYTPNFSCDLQKFIEESPTDPTSPTEPSLPKTVTPEQTCCEAEGGTWDSASGCNGASEYYESCYACVTSSEIDGGTWTELGCISASQEGIVIAIMRIFFGVVSGLAIIRFIQAGIMLNTDDPEKIKEGKSIAVSALIALIFAGLVILILDFIGLHILGIADLIPTS